MVTINTALCKNSTRVMILGSGELGKEIAIECQRLGIEVISVDSYSNAPAMHVSHRHHVIDMLNPKEIKRCINLEHPDFIVPEIEAISTNALIELEKNGYNIVPSAKTIHITMNRKLIRVLVSKKLNILTSEYQFASSFDELKIKTKVIGYPCLIKPIMSSSGKGQSVIYNEKELRHSWEKSQTYGRTSLGEVIIEKIIPFDFEITLLVVNSVDGMHFCLPIGHRQEKGDYQESWQPHKMDNVIFEKAKKISKKIVSYLGGYGIFGVEFFIYKDKVIFSEISPRPHDTGMVTLISQNLSEFALHVRSFLKLPIGKIRQYGPSSSVVICGNELYGNKISFSNIECINTNQQIRIFSKPNIKGYRRLGVILDQDETIERSLRKAKKTASKILIKT
ncbi:purT [Wigglesworthia glossinidia endosymbiont of Glossina brevipalpis]|uniref:Formate-dependent phosphoribosylglycinamide formyltransferase n=1 Tax=Wigglesworthia glossinidia brevipalpis TaxID=36870 RepID=PURT_WIGBR|nr:RecName: Full=Formate-dependent phosphoribosylglycinamide formyltransferase; AltName: Full=5'-phosphoribosylglycinamide transformylase 2; AltName: Full=Formate-dependent GAR transformylase; AltName: Full=GAR transformylase 2; Short=GART 2; AltName: Full=Non-folate glycinamide ribonucleotide transformylase; AltName: Full=Phosphoribosylglycinamide formyltransferase 2 [Wigglesworthia glossinidia endosymbiont of Glossina brevipalpis]BAC24437.1 purT [Wigglesworthia glossinidia endosymbiont of Glossi